MELALRLQSFDDLGHVFDGKLDALTGGVQLFNELAGMTKLLLALIIGHLGVLGGEVVELGEDDLEADLVVLHLLYIEQLQ